MSSLQRMARPGEAWIGTAQVTEPKQAAKPSGTSTSMSQSAVSSLQHMARPGEACTGTAHVTEPTQAAATYSRHINTSGRHEQLAARCQVWQNLYRDSLPIQDSHERQLSAAAACNQLIALSAVACLTESVRAVVMQQSQKRQWPPVTS